jgi:hypothetical protein
MRLRKEYITESTVQSPADDDDEYSFMDGVEMANLMDIYERESLPAPATLSTRTFEDIWAYRSISWVVMCCYAVLALTFKR